MLRLVPKQYSFHSVLYDKIPENHILKRIVSIIDFSFINEILKEYYCETFGRPAKEPELMCKLLFLQEMYNLSDERLIDEASYNLAYLYFLGLDPEDTLPDKSLLSKFRTKRFPDDKPLDKILTHIVEQCVDKGLIKGNSVSIDATHIEANTIKKTPERLMKHLARKVLKALEEETGQVPVDLPAEPEYMEIEDHKEAKAVMKEYVDRVIECVEKQVTPTESNTNEMIKKTKEIINDPKFMQQKGVRSVIDEDARVGRKSKSQDFFGYTTEFVMTTDERIITSVRTASGSYMDGNFTNEMLNDTLSSGIKVKEVYADKAYFRKSILDEIKVFEAKARS